MAAASPTHNHCNMTMNTSRLLSLTLLGALALSSTPSLADKHEGFPKVKVGLERCVPTVLAKYPGEVLQAVLKSEGGKATWEIEIDAGGGKLWDIECSGVDGKLTEAETRVTSADAPGFKEKVKFTEAQATETALAKYPGKVERVEYEIEADGRVVYEFDIKPTSGPDWRVEVDAATGKITESSTEWLEIGRL